MLCRNDVSETVFKPGPQEENHDDIQPIGGLTCMLSGSLALGYVLLYFLNPLCCCFSIDVEGFWCEGVEVHGQIIYDI